MIFRPVLMVLAAGLVVNSGESELCHTFNSSCFKVKVKSGCDVVGLRIYFDQFYVIFLLELRDIRRQVTL